MTGATDTTTGRFGGDDRAVSEVVAFVLVFGVILTSVALLSVTGFQAMDGYQEAEQVANAERAMDALTENVNDVLRYDGIDRRHGELTLREGTVTAGSSGTVVNVSVGGDPIGDDKPFSEIATEDGAFDVGEFAYHYESETIAYEAGGLVRADDTGSVLLEDPLLTCRDDTAVVTLAVVDSQNRSIQSHDGLGVTVVETDPDRHTRIVDVTGDANVSIGIDDTEYERAWHGAVSAGDWDVEEHGGYDPDDGDVIGVCNADRAVVTVVEIDVRY
ncbi:DUF7289 family protein [Natronobacterium gregoryi]|uniref:Uncharacterized protein n=2 Tax=Natronobacterium gregoryi TaxID=44930 RepID=L0AF54_NATGS|nr:hypothetical protein [Natronobacterium gregoryi]AFZ71762.1 hypothetical protein Natgr_0509 [Natronobacterium gregoryi SP2]ELY72853.1 hypothetical protein C490_02491 [Natronobacterium gregoryi SP2]PLK21057.1 hypothetical protein CYV19_06390 [Natronobacterium gregoryi SP2]SFI88404.1 hypothetical protein SAMN05443661_10861 [Natronobacterium gregoryi]